MYFKASESVTSWKWYEILCALAAETTTHSSSINDSLFIMAGALAILGGDGGGSYEKRIVLCLDLYPVEVVQHLHNFL